MKLSSAAKNVEQKGARAINKHWYQRFYGFWHHEIAEKVVAKVEKTRVAKCTEATVKEHFFAKGAGLRDTLIRAGIMDPETGHIADPRRVLNRDEMPQFFDFTAHGQGTKKVGTGCSNPARTAERENRETGTIDMVQDLGGFLYGPQILVARKSLTGSCAPNIACETFDAKIHELEGYSTFGLVSVCECGVQTGVTLLARYKMLNQELIARGVPRPVVELTDNHASRYDDAVMAYCEEIQVEQWNEQSKTSHMFQALDQNNNLCHGAYQKGKVELKGQIAVALTHKEHQAERARIEAGGAPSGKAVRIWEPSEVTIRVQEFITIICLIWFSWSNKITRVMSWRKVGITVEGLAPWLINRTQFVVKEATDGGGMTCFVPVEGVASTGAPSSTSTGESSRRSSGRLSCAGPKELLVRYVGDDHSPERIAPKRLSELVTPPSEHALRAGTAARLAKKLKRVEGVMQEWEEFQTNPMHVKMLEPLQMHAVPETAARDTLCSYSGSFQYNDIRVMKANKRSLEATALKEVAEKAAAKTALSVAWDKCGLECKCPIVFFGGVRKCCPVKGMRKCLICGDVKKSVCQKQACKLVREAA